MSAPLKCPPRFPTGSKSNRKNPFTKAGRNNFPGLDNALSVVSPAKDKQKQQQNEGNDQKKASQKQEHEQDQQYEQSDANQSTSSQDSSLLNMSIGARAALNEHMRHIAKYGFDGSPVDENNVVEVERDPRDEEWNLLLDSDGSPADTETSFPIGHPSFIAGMSFGALNESIEVTTDVSQDFFNSSRVMILATPERNRDRGDMVVTRHEFYEVDSSCEMDDNASSNFAPELQACLGITKNRSCPEVNTSFVSFSAADLSRIDSVCDSEYRCSEFSFQEDAIIAEPDIGVGINNSVVGSGSDNSSNNSKNNKYINSINKNDGNDRSPNASQFAALDMVTSSFCHDLSFGAMSRTSTPPSLLHAAKKHAKALKMPPKNSFPRHSRQTTTNPKIEIPRDAKENNENAMPSPDPPGLSAGEVKKVQTPQSKNRFHPKVPGETPSPLDNMEDYFLRTIDNLSSDSPSPISQANLSSIELDPNSSGTVSGKKNNSSSSSKSASRGAKSSTSSSSFPRTDRRHFRTVVPTRVFLTEPDEFPDEEDSFSVNRGQRQHSSTTTNPRRSLLNSFDAANESCLREC